MKPTFSSHKKYLSFLLCLLCFLFITYLLFFGDIKEKDTECFSNFDSFTEHLFRENITANTINLHYTLSNPASYGITDYKPTLGSISNEGHEKSVAELENMKKALNSFSYDTLSRQNQMTYDVLSLFVNQELSASSYYYYNEFLRSSTGTQTELPILFAEYTFRNEKDVTDYLALLSQLESYFKQISSFEEEKSKKGLFMSDFAAENILAQCEQFLNQKDNHYLLETFDSRIDSAHFLNENQKAAYKEKNKIVFTEHVLPAYENLKNCMNSLKNTGVNDKGLCYLPEGKDYYTYLIHSYTGTSFSIPELEKQVQKQRETDLAEISNLIAAHPSLASSSSDSFCDSNPTNMLHSLKESILKDFPAPVETNFTVKYVDDALSDYLAPAFYLTAPIDDISQNCIYINPKCNYTKVKLFTTLAHEGYPGHLYQTIMTASYGIPSNRSILNYPGYTEGWATYVEMMSYHYTGLDENLATILQLNQSAILSLYSTADFGIHYDGWSFSDTKSFFSKYGFSDEKTIREIYELIVEEPGHYQKYYIGYLQFLQLKNCAKEFLNDQYSDKVFHEAVLRMGPAPFPILEKYLPEYLKEITMGAKSAPQLTYS